MRATYLSQCECARAQHKRTCCARWISLPKYHTESQAHRSSYHYHHHHHHHYYYHYYYYCLPIAIALLLVLLFYPSSHRVNQWAKWSLLLLPATIMMLFIVSSKRVKSQRLCESNVVYVCNFCTDDEQSLPGKTHYFWLTT